MKFKKEISDTAFLVNESRARQVDISKDIYARYWISSGQIEDVKALWNDFSKEVYPYDDIEVSVRNRYMLEQQRHFFSTCEDPVFVNVGAGLTSYPFLHQSPSKIIEIDFPHILRYKQECIDHLIEQNKFPQRDITFIPADLNQPSDRKQLTETLSAIVTGKPSFIQMEGVSYYLSRQAMTGLMELFTGIQDVGSRLVFDFWKPEMEDHPVFNRLQKFFSDRFGYNMDSYLLLGESFVNTLEGYKVLELTDVTEQEEVFTNRGLLKSNPLDTLLENYVLLEKR